MRWEERLLRELDDLEQQAEGLHLAERDATVAELRVSEYAEVDLVSRLHASVGAEVSLATLGGGTVSGVVTRSGRDWVLVGRDRAQTVVPAASIVRVRGASDKAVPEAARPLTARLGLASVLRQVAADREEVALTLVDGSTSRGRIGRVGADFLEVVGTSGQVELVGFGVLALLRRG